MARKRKTPEKDVIGRLTDAGEEALNRLGELPGGKIMLDVAGNFRERLDEMTKKLRAIDPLERRVAAIEKRLDSLEKPATSSSSAKRSSTSRARTTRKQASGTTKRASSSG
jgi:hypothetical protein